MWKKKRWKKKRKVLHKIQIQSCRQNLASRSPWVFEERIVQSNISCSVFELSSSGTSLLKGNAEEKFVRNMLNVEMELAEM